MGEYRVPQPRSRGSLDHRPELSWRADKERLVNLFKDFRSSAVETEHLQMARELIDRHRGQKWYEYVPLDQILEENGVSFSIVKYLYIRNEGISKCWSQLCLLH